jgi:hypothetical protein
MGVQLEAGATKSFIGSDIIPPGGGGSVEGGGGGGGGGCVEGVGSIGAEKNIQMIFCFYKLKIVLNSNNNNNMVRNVPGFLKL